MKGKNSFSSLESSCPPKDSQFAKNSGCGK
jgi:hypothetical protein